MPPRAAKRARRSRAGAAAAASPALTSAECTKMVDRLSADDARAILADLVASSPAARAAVEAELKRQDEAPVDLEEYSSRASNIVWSLDGLRDSQIYQRSGEVTDKLTDLVSECQQRLSTTQAFQAIAAVVVCVQGEAEGQIRKCVFGCGGFETEVADVLRDLAEDMSEEEKASVDDAVEDLQGAVEALEDFGSGFNLAEVVKDVRGE